MVIGELCRSFSELESFALTAESSDVREDFDFAAGRVPRSLNLPISVFEGALSLDQGEKLVLRPMPVLRCRGRNNSALLSRRCSLSTLLADFFHSTDDFARRYLFSKPAPSQKIILYCRSGRRSKIALDICKGAGFTA